MIQKCKQNKERDLGHTIPDLAIDITEAVETGVIKNTPVSIQQYNMMQDTDEVGSVVRDTFTALDASKVVDINFNQSRQ